MIWPLNFICFDTETGGLWPQNNPILEIALIGVNQELEKVFTYETYVKPYRGKKTDEFPEGKELIVTKEALDANGINMKDVIEKGIDAKKLYKDLVDRFKDFKSGRYQKPILAGHNIGNFDLSFLEYLFNLYEEPSANGTNALYKYVDRFVFDTITYSRIKFGKIERPNYQLGDLCKSFGIELTDAHRAMNDTIATTDLVCAYIKDVREGKINIKESINNIRFRDQFQFQL